VIDLPWCICNAEETNEGMVPRASKPLENTEMGWDGTKKELMID